MAVPKKKVPSKFGVDSGTLKRMTAQQAALKKAAATKVKNSGQ